jgi:hypothetical protein
LESIVESTPAGATFCVEAGTYTVSASGITMQSGDTINGAGDWPQGTRGATDPSVKIKGNGYTIFTGSATNVTLRDLDVTDATADQSCSDAPSCPQAVKPGSNWTFRNMRFHHIDSRAIGGFSGTTGIVLDNVEIDHVGNRFDGPDNNGFSAAVKGTDGYVVRNSYVHDNNQGIWCDRDCSGGAFVVADSIVEDNCSFGIHYENTYFNASTSASASITNNIVRGNDWCNLANKADIGIVSAQNAVVSGNQVGATPAHPQSGDGFAAFDRGLGSSTGTASNNAMGGDVIGKCEAPYVCR